MAAAAPPAGPLTAAGSHLACCRLQLSEADGRLQAVAHAVQALLVAAEGWLRRAAEQRQAAELAHCAARCRAEREAGRLRPEEAAARAALQREWASGAAQLGIALRRGPKPAAPTPAPPGCEVREIPGRGRGLFLTRAARAGETLWEEPPVLVCRTQEDIRDWLRHSPPAARAAVQTLAGTTEPLTEQALLAVLNRFCFSFHGHKALFSGACLLNHSCDPNIVYQSGESFGRIVATDDLRPGDELLHTYARREHGWCTWERRSKLLAEKGFLCDCRLCLQPDRTRPLQCPRCTSGVCLSTAIRGQLAECWRCSSCGASPAAAEMGPAIEQERAAWAAWAAAVRAGQVASPCDAAALLRQCARALPPQHWICCFVAQWLLGARSAEACAMSTAALRAVLDYYFAWREDAQYRLWYAWTLTSASRAVIDAAAAGLAGELLRGRAPRFAPGDPQCRALRGIAERKAPAAAVSVQRPPLAVLLERCAAALGAAPRCSPEQARAPAGAAPSDAHAP
eukprot:TRINITY_DN28294_c0_g1_i3.p1 TRINITY_DN28294_c0_g1~~TRINITY_DN28294_c0_g1_i3.p1  ORF type:complete len:511 (+),score=117.74 TRINITY_DN28294_c0_g1_i3:119-1651(+)